MSSTSNKPQAVQAASTPQKAPSSDSSSMIASTTVQKLETSVSTSQPKVGGGQSPVVAEPATQTKMAVATEIYKMMIVRRDVTRKDIIERLVADADLSPAAASTYYQLIKRKQKA